MTGAWVSQPTGCAQGNNNQGTTACQAIPPGSTVPAKAAQGSPEYRGWWVLVPTGYDPNKPYPVIYNGAGCGDGNWFHAGEDGYPYQKVDDGGAIQVGLDYDTYSDVPGCYDARESTSNDVQFFPWLQNHIEQEFCIDTQREFLSAYGGVQDGTGLVNQISCIMPSKLRAQVTVAGGEVSSPGFPALGYPGSLPVCNPAPIAAFFVHDFNDTDDTYANEVATACPRILSQNGCTNTTCNPLDPTLTTPYKLPAGVTPPAQTKCVQFNGCPAAYPVVFCVTQNQDHSDGQNWGVTTLFWDFMSGLAPASGCPAGEGYQKGICAVCPAGDTVCNESCVNEQTDPSHCGSCGTFCPTNGACAAGTCVCPIGEVVCNGACVDEQTDDNHCGGCAAACPTNGACAAGTCVCPTGEVVCNGACVDEQTDPTNCGACSSFCPTGATCGGGSCFCPTGELVCDGSCVDEQTDPSNCGACDNGCGGSVCAGGACACPTICAGLCVDEQTDPSFCGACDNNCPGSAPFCRSGVCSAN
jgi:poly(3-hydroxybutyrate) depolymerase